MGVVLSCFNQSHSDEEESLLRGQQGGYGVNDNTGDDYDVMQQHMKEEERKAQARENELRDIVNHTNDKLIDISMISNSGIVVQSNDLMENNRHNNKSSIEDNETDEQDNHLNPGTSNLAAIMSNNTSLNANNIDDDISQLTSPTEDIIFTQLNTKTHMPQNTKNILRDMHKKIKDSLDTQFLLKVPGDLTMSF